LKCRESPKVAKERERTAMVTAATMILPMVLPMVLAMIPPTGVAVTVLGVGGAAAEEAVGLSMGFS
jgi:hypothetical protein